MLLTIVIVLLVLLWWEVAGKKFFRIDELKQNTSSRIDDLEKTMSSKHENLGEDISYKHIGLGSKIQGRYKNLGEKISNEHMTIKGDTRNVYDMMLTEKQNRELLYNNNVHGKEILEKLDFLRETVDQNAQLTHEVYSLKTENQKLSSERDSHVDLEEVVAVIRSFERKLNNLEETADKEAINECLKKLKIKLSQYKFD